jgi:hypothetical protein
MTTSFRLVETLPGMVIFQVTLMRELMKTIESAPLKEVVSAIKKMNKQIDILFDKAAKAQEEVQAKESGRGSGPV